MAIEHAGDYSEFTVVYGYHEIKVPMNYRAMRVYVSLEEDDFQVCGGSDASYICPVILENDGFVIRVNIKSDIALVRWVAY